MNKEQEAIGWMLKDIAKNYQDKLNDWEEGFIGSCEERVANGVALSEKMHIKLNDVYERLTENDR